MSGIKLKPWQERVVIERDELFVKIAKLGSFIGDSLSMFNIPEVEKNQLIRQLNAMTLYYNILQERIAEFKE